MSRKQSGGVSVRSGKGPISVSGDIVGRDKFERHQNIYVDDATVEEKSGCVLMIEKAVTFVWGFLIAGIVMAVFMGLLGALAAAVVGGPDAAEAGAIIGAVVGVILGLGFAVSGASNISRYRGA